MKRFDIYYYENGLNSTYSRELIVKASDLFMAIKIALDSRKEGETGIKIDTFEKRNAAVIGLS